jgi:hypothetical protein
MKNSGGKRGLTVQGDYWEQKILSAIGKPVHFKYPDGSVRHGILKDRVVEVDDNPAYFNVIDFILFGDEEYLRFSYYHVISKQGKDVLKFAGQTSLSAPPEFVKNLFDAAKEKPWFRKLLD